MAERFIDYFCELNHCLDRAKSRIENYNRLRKEYQRARIDTSSNGRLKQALISKAQEIFANEQRYQEYLRQWDIETKVQAVVLGSTASEQQAKLVFPPGLEKDGIPFNDINRNSEPHPKRVISYKNEHGNLDGTIVTDAPQMLSVSHAGIKNNFGEIVVTLDTSQLEWGKNYKQYLIITYNGSDSPKKIPVRIKVNDNQVVLTEVEILSKRAVFISILIGLIFVAVLGHNNLRLSDIMPAPFFQKLIHWAEASINVGMELALLGSTIAVFVKRGISAAFEAFIARGICVLVISFIISIIIGPWFINYLAVPILMGFIMAFSALALRKHNINLLNNKGINKKTCGDTLARLAKLFSASLILAIMLLLFSWHYKVAPSGFPTYGIFSYRPDRDIRKAQEEAEAKNRAQRKAQQEAEAQRKAQQETAERISSQEAQKKAQEDAEAKRRAQERAEAQRRAQQEAEAQRKAQEEAEAKRRAQEILEAQRRGQQEAEAQRKAQQEAEVLARYNQALNSLQSQYNQALNKAQSQYNQQINAAQQEYQLALSAARPIGPFGNLMTTAARQHYEQSLSEARRRYDQAISEERRHYDIAASELRQDYERAKLKIRGR